MPLIAALSNTLDQIVDAPRKIDNLALSLQFELDGIIARSRMIYRVLEADERFNDFPRNDKADPNAHQKRDD